MAACALLAVVLIGDGYLRTRRADQHAVAVKSAVSAMSIQELARMSEQCDSERAAANSASTSSEGTPSQNKMSQSASSARSPDTPSQGSPGTPATHDADYCLQVWREIEARPMQAVDPRMLHSPARQSR